MILSSTAPLRSPVASGELLLRICSSARQGQVVRLRAPKCTIGSAPHCTLRLVARGVQPLHCLIVRGPQATVVRRWSDDTRLNGHTFDDATLSAGDRLSVGPLEFEVLDPAHPLTRPAELTPVAAVEPGARSRIAFDRLAEQLRQANRQQRRRARRLLRELRTARGRLADLQKRRPAESQLAVSKDHDELERLRRELDARRESLDTRRRQWEAERAELETRLAGRDDELARHRGQLDADRTALDADRRAWQSLQAEQESRLNQRLDELEARRAELETAGQEELAHARRQWDAERTAAADELRAAGEKLSAQQEALDAERQALATERAAAERQAAEAAEAAGELAAREAAFAASCQALEIERGQWQAERAELERLVESRAQELDALRAELAELRAELDGARRALADADARAERTSLERDLGSAVADEPLEAAFVAPREDAPVSSADIFRRLGTPAPRADDEPEMTTMPTMLLHDSPRLGTAEKTGAAVSHHGPADESLDDYTARWLARLRGEASSVAEERPRRPTPAPSSPVEQDEWPDAAAPAMHSAPAASAEAGRPHALAPRCIAPEKLADLKAMREVANHSAQHALDSYACRTLKKSIGAKLLVAVVAAGAGAVAARSWWLEGGNLTLLAAGAAFIACAYWLVQYAVLTGRLNVTQTGNLDWPHSGAETDAPAAVAAAADTADPVEDSIAVEATASVAAGEADGEPALATLLAAELADDELSAS